MIVFPGILLAVTFRKNPLGIAGGALLAVLGCAAGVIAIVSHFVGQQQ
jgi:hypothetical protein